jgi:hypothetical protein
MLHRALLFTMLTLFSCRGRNGEMAPKKFDPALWTVGTEGAHPHRESMLNDLIASRRLKGKPADTVVALLGAPTRVDNGHLFYRVREERIGSFITNTKTLVIKLTPDSTVEWTKIHQ